MGNNTFLGHNFQFGKFAVSNIQIVDYYGGSKYPTVPEYYNATPTPEENIYSDVESSYLNSVYRVQLV